MNSLTFTQALNGFKACGINPGDSVLVHSALRPFGNVEGGKLTIAKALLESVGVQGTLIAPAFTFKHELEQNPVIDPIQDESEMGSISETIRKFENSYRSVAYRHSLSAIGANSKTIVDVDPLISVFDMRSSFGKMLALDVKIVLAGLGYDSCTSFHFAEYILQVPYRHTLQRKVQLKTFDGKLNNMCLIDYQPKPDDSDKTHEKVYDFNKVGKILEDSGLVTVGHVGNAVIRAFKMRDLVYTILNNYPLNNNLLFADENTEFPTPLKDGILVSTGDLKDGANRLVETYWACINKEDMFIPDLQQYNK